MRGAVIIASAYDWLRGNGLWPSSIAATVYWAIPIIPGFLLGRKVLGRLVAAARSEWRELVALARQHNAAQERQAAALEAQTEHLATVAGYVSAQRAKRP